MDGVRNGVRNAVFLSRALLAAVLAAGSAAAQDEAPAAATVDRNLQPEQAAANAVTVPAGTLAVRLTVDNPRGLYSLGDALELSVSVNKPAYVTVLNIGVDGTTTVLFPYLDGTDNRIEPGAPQRISGGDTGVAIRFAAPAGTDLVKAFASTAKVPLLDPAELTRVSPQLGRARTTARNLVPEMQATIDAHSAGVEWALDTIVVTSVAGAVPAAVDAGQTVAVTEPFGLELATDKLVYAIGEPIVVTVTAARACQLTVYNIGTSGAVRRVYPNAVQPGHPVPAGVPVRIPGAGAVLASVGPAGVEGLLALCTTAAAATLGEAGALLEELFPRAGEWSGLDARNLSVIATPAEAGLGFGATARAAAALLVR